MPSNLNLLIADQQDTAADAVGYTAAYLRALSSPSVRKSFEVTGAEVGTVFGPDFGLFMKHESEKWGDVIKSSDAAIIE